LTLSHDDDVLDLKAALTSCLLFFQSYARLYPVCPKVTCYSFCEPPQSYSFFLLYQYAFPG